MNERLREAAVRIMELPDSVLVWLTVTSMGITVNGRSLREKGREYSRAATWDEIETARTNPLISIIDSAFALLRR